VTTGAGDWLISFPETRHAIAYSGVDISGELIVRAATRSCVCSSELIRDALLNLEARGMIHRVRYCPHIPDPLIVPDLTIRGNNEHSGPVWKWVYRKGPAPTLSGSQNIGLLEHMAIATRRLNDAHTKHGRRQTDRSWKKVERRHTEWCARLYAWRHERGFV
jgi:hypothetical protein